MITYDVLALRLLVLHVVVVQTCTLTFLTADDRYAKSHYALALHPLAFLKFEHPLKFDAPTQTKHILPRETNIILVYLTVCCFLFVPASSF